MIRIVHDCDQRVEVAPDVDHAIDLLVSAYGTEIVHEGDWKLSLEGGREYLIVSIMARDVRTKQWGCRRVAVMMRPLKPLSAE